MVLAFAMAAAGVVLISRLPREIRLLIVVGLALRLAGSQVYYQLSEWLYGFGDYTIYYRVGTIWAEVFWTGDAMPGYAEYLQNSVYLQDWCCTGFTVRASGFVMSLIGTDVHAAFLAFALFGYAGLIALAVAFARAHPAASLQRYLGWLVFFPSLWYWPAALGKDALMLGGLGFVVLGFIGKRGSLGWLPLVSGMTLIFMVRPQVAAVIAACMVVAHWSAGQSRWTLGRVAQLAIFIVGAALLTSFAGKVLGLELFSATEVESYLDNRGSASAYGGSAVQTGGGAVGALMGIVNVLFRPFLFEARSIASLLAALEITAFWGIIIWRRRDIAAFYRTHRHSRMLWFGIVFTAAYVLLTGLALGNLGLIARQRVHVFPFLLMFLAGGARVMAPLHDRLVPARPPAYQPGRPQFTSQPG
jgi:hypothetical protein